MKAARAFNIFCLLMLTKSCHGGTTLIHGLQKELRQTSPGSTVVETQQTTASVAGSVSSSAEGNGDPNSALAYAWQGGQTTASSSQTATADKNTNNNATAQSTGFSNCQQGYTGNAGGANSNSANSIGYALCNATSAHGGSLSTLSKARPPARLPSFGQLGQQLAQFQGNQQQSTLGKPPAPIVMNYTFNQLGEAQSGQVHNSLSNASSPHVGFNIFSGGFSNTPQGTMAVHHSGFDHEGKPTAFQDFLEDQGLNSEEHTLVATGGHEGEVGHSSGGMAHINGLQTNTTSHYNSLASQEEELLDEEAMLTTPL